MRRTSKPKRNQHFLPRLYLKGFVDKDASSSLWEYRKDAPFNPAGHNSVPNPYHKPIRKAGAIPDLYAVRKDGLVVDFDTYEDRLQKLETPAIPIFRKLRHYLKHDQLTEAEKLTFARYVLLMIKRMPSEQKKRAKILWPPIVNQMEYRLTKSLDDYAAQVDLNDPSKREIYEKRKSEVFQVIEHFRKGIPDELLLDAMLGQSDINFPAILSRMTWQFLIAPDHSEFITCDNPVFFFEELGINKNISELSFPISKSVCMVASWQPISEGYFAAQASQVQTINERTARKADRYVYAASCSEEIYNQMLSMETPYLIKLIYPPYYLYKNIPVIS